jgi:hypothetical protein
MMSSESVIAVQMTEEQLKVQIQLNDLAVKAAGMQVAEAAIVLCRIYQQALQQPSREAASHDAVQRVPNAE